MDYLIFFPINEALIILTTFGLGLFLNKILNLNPSNQTLNYSEVCLYGFCLILVISQIINFFSPIKEFFFWIVLGLSIIYILSNNIEKNSFIRWFTRILILSIFLIPLKLVIKGHDDLYYHLPKIELINNYRIIFGIGNFYESFAFTNGWSHITAFFNFLNGANKNIYLVSFVFFILALETLYQNLKKNNNFSIKIFSLISIIFLSIKFYRLQEFGNDYQSMILIFLIFNLYFQYLSNKNDYDSNYLIKKILLLSLFASLYKIHGSLVLILLAIFFIKKEKIIKKNFIKLYFFLTIALCLTFLTSFVNSGCLIFPIEKTCLEKKDVPWSMSDKVKKTNLGLKSYNKSYETYVHEHKKNTMSAEQWINNFNWFFFHFSSKQIYIGIIKIFFILISILFLSFKLFKIKFDLTNKFKFIFFIFSLLIILIWSIEIPLLRAGGYAYISCCFIFLYCSLISKSKIKNFNFFSNKIIIFSVMFLIFSNILRINYEIKKYNPKNLFYFSSIYKKIVKKDFFEVFKERPQKYINIGLFNYIVIYN